MRHLVERARELAPQRKAILHCWRGGQRSGALAWLLGFAGFEIDVIEGGYKAYRAEVHRGLATTSHPFLVLGGKTGSGKTDLLHRLAAAGEQVVDLEGLANHKGSAFGWIGEDAQPTTEQFENDLYEVLLKLNPMRRVWLENESRGIGHVYLPVEFMEQLQQSTLINIVVGQTARVERLVDCYTGNMDGLLASFDKIKKKLGGQHFQAAIEALQRGDFARAAEIALVYYDKTYQYGLDNSKSNSVINVDLTDVAYSEQVAKLIEAADSIEAKVALTNPVAVRSAK
jgi:tRNA 2-selenouridine synthase